MPCKINSILDIANKIYVILLVKGLHCVSYLL